MLRTQSTNVQALSWYEILYQCLLGHFKCLKCAQRSTVDNSRACCFYASEYCLPYAGHLLHWHAASVCNNNCLK